jgi:hypothetical protein
MTLTEFGTTELIDNGDNIKKFIVNGTYLAVPIGHGINSWFCNINEVYSEVKFTYNVSEKTVKYQVFQ